MNSASKATARRLITCLDLTSLQDDQTDDIAQLCARSATPHGTVAAVCSWPRHAERMARALPTAPPKIAVVINFPNGSEGSAAASREARSAVDAGAQELDLVVPYRAWLEGNTVATGDMVSAVRAAAPSATLKVILETGAFGDQWDGIAAIAETAIVAGADMLKTSTGKISQGASLPAARVLLERIRDAGRPVGFKASGGIRSFEEAAAYLALAEEVMGEGWATPVRFRIGASSLLGELLGLLEATET